MFLVCRRALAAHAVWTFASFVAETGLRFDRICRVYSQKVQPSVLGQWHGLESERPAREWIGASEAGGVHPRRHHLERVS